MALLPKALYLSRGPETLYAVMRECCSGIVDMAFLPEGDGGAALREIADAEVVIVAADPLDATLIAHARRLRLVHHQGVGYHDTVDLDALGKTGARLAIARSGTEATIAEHALLLMLSVLRRLPLLDASMRSGKWDINRFRAEARTLTGRRVGFVGMGHIGRKLAELLNPFGIEGLYCTRTERLSPEEEQRLGLHYVPLGDLLAQSEIVTLHAPLTLDTRNMISQEALSLMRPGSVLVNTARGGLVDERALYQALASGHLAGAGLDVFADEPPASDNPLFSLPNVVLTPHVAGATIDAFRNKMDFIAANISRFFRGEPILCEIDLPSPNGNVPGILSGEAARGSRGLRR